MAVNDTGPEPDQAPEGAERVGAADTAPTPDATDADALASLDPGGASQGSGNGSAQAGQGAATTPSAGGSRPAAQGSFAAAQGSSAAPQGSFAAPQASRRAPEGRGAPAWVVPMYVSGLVLLYVGERILSTFESGRWMASGLGLSLTFLATLVRFLPAWRAGGDRASIERVMTLLSVAGLAGVALYGVGTEAGLRAVGLMDADDKTLERARALLGIGWMALIVLSVVPMIFADVALYPMRHAERLEGRRVRAAAGTGLVLAMAAMYGALFVYAASGSEAKVDFSYFKTSEPSESTRKLVEGLHEPVKITAFYPEVSPVRGEVARYLQHLAAGVSNLKVQVVDRYLSPKLAEELKALRDGEIIISKGESKRSLSIGTDLEEARPKLKTLDRDLQEKLLKLLRERRNVYMTTGHGELNDAPAGGAPDEERSSSLLKKLLEKQHYLVKNLGLSEGLGSEVPDDADIVMVLGPTQPFAAEELAALKSYTQRGGKLFLALDADAVSAPGMELAEGSAAAMPGAEPSSSSRAAPAASAASAASAAPGAASKPAGAAGKAGTEPPSKSAAREPGALAAAQSAAASAAAAPDHEAAMRSATAALAGIVGLRFETPVLANDRVHVRKNFNDSDRVWVVASRFSSHASVSTLSRNAPRAAILVAGAGSLERAPSSNAQIDFPVRTPSGTFRDLNRNYRFDDGESRNQYAVAAAVSQPAAVPRAGHAAKDAKDAKDAKAKGKAGQGADNPADGEMRAFVLADSNALSDLVMANFMTNQLLVVDAVRWLGGEESFSGEVNTEEDVRLEHSQQKDLVWFYGIIFGAPALVLGLGLAVSMRSRRTRAPARRDQRRDRQAGEQA